MTLAATVRATGHLSSARQLVELVRASACRAVPHSWERYSHTIQGAVKLAIGSGFEFDLVDYGKFPTRCLAGAVERHYALAIVVGNRGAAKSIEAYLERKPFFANGVDPGWDCSGFVHCTGSRKRERLAVGFQFQWEGERVSVTSFGPAGSHVVACSYTPYPEHKVARRFRITREDLKAAAKGGAA